MSFLNELRRAFRENDLISPGNTPLLVGVSGGVDSLVLLHALRTLDYTLHIATLDHGLRGEAGASDAAFVEAMARAWGIPCTRGQADTAALAKAKGVGIEHAARLVRYDFLASAAREIGADRVAIAHHADDQAETVLLHLVRGSGIGGLKGMAWIAPLPGHPDLNLIRPMLGVRRSEIEAYACENGLTPRVDATNAETAYTRNKIRLDVLPLLRQINPDVDTALIRLADNAAADDAYLNQRLIDEIAGHVEIGEGWIKFPRFRLCEMSPAMQRRFVLWSAQALKANQSVSVLDEMPVSHERIMAALAMVASRSSEIGAVIELGGRLRMRLDYGTIIIEDETGLAYSPTDVPLIEPDAEIALNVPGVADLNGWRLEIKRDRSTESGVPIRIPSGATAVIRSRRTGDTFRVHIGRGEVGTRRITRWMIDKRIPRAVRDRIPLLVVNGQVASVFWKSILVNPDFAPAEDESEYLFYLRTVAC